MRRKAVFCCILIALTAASAVPADVLVMTNGQQVKTKGPWKIKGRQVIFTTPEGRLAMLRLSEVDLEASERATNPPPPPPPRRKAKRPKFPRRRGPAPKPVMVLTNENISAANSNTFLGAFTLTVNEIIREARGSLEIDPVANPEAQGQIDALFAEMDQVVGLIESTCAKYPTLVEPLRYEEDIESFHRQLNRCANDLKAKLPSVRGQAREVLAQAIPKMRETAEEVKSRLEDRRSREDEALKDEEEAFDDDFEDEDGDGSKAPEAEDASAEKDSEKADPGDSGDGPRDRAEGRR